MSVKTLFLLMKQIKKWHERENIHESGDAEDVEVKGVEGVKLSKG